MIFRQKRPKDTKTEILWLVPWSRRFQEEAAIETIEEQAGTMVIGDSKLVSLLH